MDGLALLNEAQSAGLSVTADGHRLVVRGPRRADRLAKLLIQHKADILPLLSASPKLPTTPSQKPGVSIVRVSDLPPADCQQKNQPPARTPGALELVNWFTSSEPTLPREPFRLRPGTRVVDPERFYASLRKDIEAGPTSARASSGLVADLADLRRLRNFDEKFGLS